MGGPSLAKLLEALPTVRKRFREGKPWLREPDESMGENPMQTTKALEYNCSILSAMLRWSQKPKLSIKQLEPQAQGCG